MNPMAYGEPHPGEWGNSEGAPGGYGRLVPPNPVEADNQIIHGEINNELSTLESMPGAESFKHARRLLAREANELENSINPEWIELDIHKPIMLTQKILIPTFRYPNYNFVGKILGPKGANVQNFAKQYKVHISVLGRGSTKNPAREQELYQSGDPQYAHFGAALHVRIDARAVPALAYERMTGAMQALAELLVPNFDNPFDNRQVIDASNSIVHVEGENGEGGEPAEEDSTERNENGDNGSNTQDQSSSTTAGSSRGGTSRGALRGRTAYRPYRGGGWAPRFGGTIPGYRPPFYGAAVPRFRGGGAPGGGAGGPMWGYFPPY